MGLIIFDFSYSTTPQMLDKLIKKNMHIAIATNAISVTGKKLNEYININDIDKIERNFRYY